MPVGLDDAMAILRQKRDPRDLVFEADMPKRHTYAINKLLREGKPKHPVRNHRNKRNKQWT